MQNHSISTLLPQYDESGRIATDEEAWWEWDALDEQLTIYTPSANMLIEHDTCGTASAAFAANGQVYGGQCGCGKTAGRYDYHIISDAQLADALAASDSWEEALHTLAEEVVPSMEQLWEEYAHDEMALFLRDVERDRSYYWCISDEDDLDLGLYLDRTGHVWYATPTDSIPLTGDPALVARATEAARAIRAALEEDDE